MVIMKLNKCQNNLRTIRLMNLYQYFKFYNLQTNLFKNIMIETHQNQPFQLEKGQPIVNGKYKVLAKLGSGMFSSIYAVTMTKGKKQIIRAIKVERSNVKQPQINSQVTVLNRIKEINEDEVGFAKLYQYGFESEYNYMVMTMLGPNLQQLLKLCGGNFSLKTTIIIGLQIIDRLQRLHNEGFVYADVRPDNFVVGLGVQSPFIYIIDFGFCKRYKNKGTNQHIIYRENVHYEFNQIFASINAHNHIQYSRRDDIESLLYLIIFMRNGKLPWIKQNQNKRLKVTDAHMQEIKKRITPQSLCFKMPLEIIDLTYYIKSIEFYEKPDYNFIRKMLYRCLERQNIEYDVVYDWNTLQQVDFKVFSGEPKIVFRNSEINLQQNMGRSQSLMEHLDDNQAQEQEQESKLI